MNLEIEHDEAAQRFSVNIDGRVARLEYQSSGPEILDYYSTFVPTELRGRGIASQLVRRALEYARESKKRVLPTCWFVRNAMDRDTRYDDLRVES